MRNLMCVKSLITILLVGTVCVLCFLDPLTYSETLKNCVTMVVTFYFAHQQEKMTQKGDGSGVKDNRTL